MSSVVQMCVMEGRKVKTPVRAHAEDAGIDIFAPLDMETVTLNPGEDVLIKTGLRVAVPEGYAMIVMNKSGVATKKRLIRGSCLIDVGYTGELGIHLNNIGTKPTTIEAGEKITQVILVPIGYHAVDMISEEEYMNKYNNSERGEGGFGSTGV